MKKLILLSLTILLFTASGFSQATKQTQPVTETSKTKEQQQAIDDAKLLVEITNAEATLRLCALDSANAACKEDGARKLAELYSEALKKPDTSRFVIARILTEYQNSREDARSAPQVSQVADEASIKMQFLVIAQNQRIIELLEQLVKKK
jgi:hypothetical protein